MADGAATQARRQRPARFTDLRLWAGLGLLAASAVAGALILSPDGDAVSVWRATRDLSVGAVPADLEAVEVAGTAAGHYARPGETLTGVLRWPVAAGELLPLSALSEPTSGPTRQVTVPVDPLHAPMSLQPGDRVDVWSTPRADASVPAEPEPRLVLAAASVASVSEESLGIGGELGVVLAVPADEVAGVVGATRAAVLDLVAVPVTSQVEVQ